MVINFRCSLSFHVSLISVSVLTTNSSCDRCPVEGGAHISVVQIRGFYLIILSTYNFTCVDIFPSLESLILLKWEDGNGYQHSFRLISKVCSRWRDIGLLLKWEWSELEGLASQYRGDAKQCWCHVMGEWLESGGTVEYPATWRGLLTLLQDIECSQVAIDLETALASVTPPPPPPLPPLHKEETSFFDVPPSTLDMPHPFPLMRLCPYQPLHLHPLCGLTFHPIHPTRFHPFSS